MRNATKDLYRATVQSLAYGDWGKARIMLDDLARSDNRENVPELDAYPSAPKLRPEFRAMLADRIGLANSAADRKRLG